MIKLAAVGVLGYVGYKYYRWVQGLETRHTDAPQIPLAGGPLSSDATIQQNPDQPPVDPRV